MRQTTSTVRTGILRAKIAQLEPSREELLKLLSKPLITELLKSTVSGQKQFGLSHVLIRFSCVSDEKSGAKLCLHWTYVNRVEQEVSERLSGIHVLNVEEEDNECAEQQ